MIYVDSAQGKVTAQVDIPPQLREDRDVRQALVNAMRVAGDPEWRNLLAPTSGYSLNQMKQEEPDRRLSLMKSFRLANAGRRTGILRDIFVMRRQRPQIFF
ncbi:hypothetical protein ACFP8Z_18910 [Gemmobacter lanyuensis]|uniref:hypothetical protein n=1 Tax=Gemmobacter lanyuensis TaxID=1054497 RepID=UPI00361E0F08